MHTTDIAKSEQRLRKIHLLQSDDKDQPIDILRKIFSMNKKERTKFIEKRRKEAFERLREIHLLRNHL